MHTHAEYIVYYIVYFFKFKFQVWMSKEPDCDIPIQVIMLALYIELQLGNICFVKINTKNITFFFNKKYATQNTSIIKYHK